ncbi:MAG: DsrE family protein, partial [Pseudomonadales bacterium]|nr:DsrE family protein [Pseudomonadales bacterium]
MASKNTNKAITFISRRAPYGDSNAQLCLEMALACAVFGQTVSYVFLDDGVYQLLKHQDARGIDSKTLGKALETLELYGIENICVDADSLSERGIQGSDLVLEVEPV